MFERFTTSAREVVRGAVRQADATGGATVGEPELLLALLERTERTDRTDRADRGRTERADRARTDSPAADVLATLGATARRASIERALAEVRRRGGISAADAEALAGLGIDVDTIVSRVEAEHGVGALAAAPRRRRSRGRFDPEARSVLERSLRIAVGRGDKHIGDEHLLLALLARPGVAATVLADHDVTYIRAERALDARARAR
ncbi:Clp protease N-terminal domain-containing protein [Streptomyces sp. NPDC021098]|uniref:Clp protease N-terminal domain-containing protein n=1 Tax=unclassified Streptomyces TaxID=2593676 RepID=UPI0037AE0175